MNGAAGTGGGGGGGAQNNVPGTPRSGSGGDGGSGIVVVRYQVGTGTAAKATGGTISFSPTK